jgi:hypothetical protein
VFVRKIFVVAIALIAALPSFLAAHHSFSAEYDKDKPVQFEGVVTKVEWTNPHARIYLDVTDASGKVVNWNLELAGLGLLTRNGWTRNSLKIGEKIKVEGFAGRRADSYRAAPSVITTADGRELFSSFGN